ncbi:hypothetical protein ACYULU_10945 [Breznakiellaceae bacterium SP9]
MANGSVLYNGTYYQVVDWVNAPLMSIMENTYNQDINNKVPFDTIKIHLLADFNNYYNVSATLAQATIGKKQYLATANKKAKSVIASSRVPCPYGSDFPPLQCPTV